jgi:hypothetical protein
MKKKKLERSSEWRSSGGKKLKSEMGILTPPSGEPLKFLRVGDCNPRISL